MLKQTRWALIATACVAAFVGLLVGRATGERQSPARKDDDRPAVSVSSPATDRVAQVAVAASTAAARTAHDAIEEIEICGLGFVPADAAAERVPADGFTPPPEVVSRVVDALRASPSEPTRALGTWLTAIDAERRALAEINAGLARCGDDEGCLDAQRSAAGPAISAARRPGVDALAREAAASADPVVYAMAVEACGTSYARVPAAGNCQLITLERWAQLDPDNAVPWTHLASAAMLRNDADAASESLYRASIAGKDRLVGDSLLTIVQPVLANGLNDVERREIGSELIGAQGWMLPPFGTPMKMCSDDALRDGNRRQICDAYASMLIDKGTTVIERGIGIRLGERLRWPAERLDALLRERDALASAIIPGSDQPRGSFSCEAQKRAIDTAIRGSSMGEIGRARAVIATSGKSIDDWARRWRQRRDDAAVLAASGASAVSAASGIPH